MALSSGTKLGPYEILTPLGVGGMGEVYRARDTRLGRDVAVKVLPQSFAQDGDRLHRFEHEARVLSALNHPNLLAIHDVGTQDAVHYLITELLEGESLRQKLAAGSLPVRKAVEYGVQMAKGLAAAHEKGIVHRDLKPDNVFITKDGQLKILDFGLAKRTAELDEHTLTIDTPATQPGVVLGTVGYMSPEQVRGKAADKRSDIFSLGALLYEMVTGQRPFRGDSSVEMMNAILKEDPPEISAQNHHVPSAMDRVIRRCLEKAPDDRFQSTRDLGFALEAFSGTSVPSEAIPAVPARPKAVSILWPAAAIVGTLLLAVGVWLWHRAQPAANPVFQRLTFQRGMVLRARFTPDGQNVVYSAAWGGAPQELFATRLGSNESRPLGVKQAELLAVSSTGEMAILLHARRRPHQLTEFEGTLARMPVDGGSPREVLDNVTDADISADGQQLALVRTGGGKERLEFPQGHVLYETAAFVSHPHISPDGRAVAFFDHPVFGDDRGFVAVVDLQGKIRRLTADWGTTEGLAWAKSGKEIWFCASNEGTRSLYSVSLTGKQHLVWHVPLDSSLMDVGRDGRVLLAPGALHGAIFAGLPGQVERDLSWLDWAILPRISSDAKAVFFTDAGQSAGNEYLIFMRKMDGSPAVRLGDGALSSLSHNGRLALSQMRSQPTKFLLLPTGIGELRKLDASGLVVQALESDWMPDDQGFYFVAAEPGHSVRTFRMLLDGSKPTPVTAEGYAGVAVSPDGKTLVVRGPEQQLFLYDLISGKPHPLRGSKLGEQCINWNESGRGIYVTSPTDFPVIIDYLDIATGQRKLWKTILPSDLAGAGNPSVHITPKGDAYVYSVSRTLSDLYLVEGLH